MPKIYGSLAFLNFVREEEPDDVLEEEPDDVLEEEPKPVQRAFARLTRFERESLLLRKRSEDYQVIEEVFDKPTLLVLNNLMNKGHINALHGVINTGKEARVYLGVRGNSENVALKIYLTVASDFRKRLPYIEGDPRFPRTKKGEIMSVWARKEYRNLQAAYRSSVPVPKPYGVYRNIVIMEFIGTASRPSLVLAQTDVDEDDYHKLLRAIKKLYRKSRLVHADLSEFNVFKWNGRLILFDFGFAVDVSHPRANEFLMRDITNINRFFSKRGVNTIPNVELLKKIIG